MINDLRLRAQMQPHINTKSKVKGMSHSYPSEGPSTDWSRAYKNKPKHVPVSTVNCTIHPLIILCFAV